MKHLRRSLLLLPLLGLVSCETTGDPTQGGLFGWSETKAQGRIYERRQTLSATEADNAYQYQRTQQLQRQRARYY